VSWEAPANMSEVTHYAVYRAEDSTGLNKLQVGGTVTVGVNSVTLPVSTPIDVYAYIVVFSKSSLAWQTTPAAAAIADTPVIDTSTTWDIINLDSTTPAGDGRPSTVQAGRHWHVKELIFYEDHGCTQPVVGSTLVASGNDDGMYHTLTSAFDGSLDTVWHSQCSPCEPLEAWLGIVVAKMVRCVRWVQPLTQGGNGVAAVALRINAVELTRATGLQGGRWEGLQYAASGHGWNILHGN